VLCLAWEGFLVSPGLQGSEQGRILLPGRVYFRDESISGTSLFPGRVYFRDEFAAR